MNDNILIVMVGLPRSGKTTRALELGYPIVSPDAIRLSIHNHHFIPEAEGLVWTIARYMVNALFEAGHHTVILDGCNTRRKRRDQWRSNKWTNKFCVMNVSSWQSIARVDAVDDPDLRTELIAAIKRMDSEYEPVSSEEGKIIR